MIEYIVLGICVLIFLGAIAFVVVAGLVKFLWKPAPARQASPPQSVPAGVLAQFQQAQAAPPAGFLEGFVNYVRSRNAEIEHDKMKATLDGIAGIGWVKAAESAPPPSPPNA